MGEWREEDVGGGWNCEKILDLFSFAECQCRCRCHSRWKAEGHVHAHCYRAVKVIVIES